MIRFRSVAVAAAAALALAGVSAQPADAGRMAPNRGRYAAIGDSYAAGVGNTPLKNSGNSGRSAAAYPVLLADQVNKVTFLAVSGATTQTVAAEQVPRIPPSVTQVTITAGGNDVVFGLVAAACTANPPAQCGTALEAALDKIPSMQENLAAMIEQVKARAPRADVYVTGYPILFQATAACATEPIDAANALLNSAIETVAKSSGATYVDVASEFIGHGVCQGPDSWILGPGSPAVLHPTDAGQRAYARAAEKTAFTSAAESCGRDLRHTSHGRKSTAA